MRSSISIPSIGSGLPILIIRRQWVGRCAMQYNMSMNSGGSSGSGSKLPFIERDVVNLDVPNSATKAVDPPPVTSYPGPNQTGPTSTPSEMPTYNPDFSINPGNFMQLLNQRGIRMIHEKAVPCPNMLTLDSNAHEPNCPFCDNNGFIHYGKNEIFGVFTGNSIQKTFEAHGVWEIGTATVTLPALYTDGNLAEFAAFDRLVLPDFTVRLWELKEYEPRPGLEQKLRYPVRKVEYASSISRDGQREKKYLQGVDFNINSIGDIVWIPGRQPHFDSHTGHGEVITWSFYAAPVYLVVQLLRELRVTQAMIDGVKRPSNLPQQVLVRRDFLPTAPETIAKR